MTTSFAPVMREESYSRRTSATYPGDCIERRVRVINGRWYDFVRVVWGTGLVTVSVTPYGRTTRLHFFEGVPRGAVRP